MVKAEVQKFLPSKRIPAKLCRFRGDLVGGGRGKVAMVGVVVTPL